MTPQNELSNPNTMIRAITQTRDNLLERYPDKANFIQAMIANFAWQVGIPEPFTSTISRAGGFAEFKGEHHIRIISNLEQTLYTSFFQSTGPGRTSEDEAKEGFIFGVIEALAVQAPGQLDDLLNPLKEIQASLKRIPIHSVRVE